MNSLSLNLSTFNSSREFPYNSTPSYGRNQIPNDYGFSTFYKEYSQC